MSKFLFFLVTSLMVFAITIYYRVGGFKPVVVEERDYAALYLVFQNQVGPYNEIEATIEKVEAWAHEHGIDCQRTFGEFLDDPQTTDERRLRSHVGCVLPAPLPAADSAQPYFYELRPARKYVWSEFDGAPSFGPFKVYPKIRKFLSERHIEHFLPGIEIYSVKNDRVITEYLVATP